MIPKVKSVELLLLMNDAFEHFFVQFRSVVFHRGSPFLLLQHHDQHIVLKVQCDRDSSKLVSLNKSDYERLRDYFRGIRLRQKDGKEEYKVVGIEFNRVERDEKLNTEFRISDGRPLDILPYVVQTGAEFVFFTE